MVRSCDDESERNYRCTSNFPPACPVTRSRREGHIAIRVPGAEVPVSRFEFTSIDLALNSLLANQPVASEYLRAAVTPQFNLSFSFVSRVSRM